MNEKEQMQFYALASVGVSPKKVKQKNYKIEETRPGTYLIHIPYANILIEEINHSFWISLYDVFFLNNKELLIQDGEHINILIESAESKLKTAVEEYMDNNTIEKLKTTIENFKSIIIDPEEIMEFEGINIEDE